MRLAITLAALLFFYKATTQNLLLTYEPPAILGTCDSVIFKVTVQNVGTTPTSPVVLSAVLPNGIFYISGSVSGATERLPLSQLAPAFDVSALAGGAAKTVSIRLSADCKAADLLDMGQLFRIDLKAQSSSSLAQVTTTPIKIETGLILIESVTPLFPEGSIGDTLSRQICVKNTRLGRIRLLHFEDRHTDAISVLVPGASSQTDLNGLLTAGFSPALFATTGNGDTWLDLNERVCFTEKIVVRDCGTPAITAPSNLKVAWGCSPDAPCRYDSLPTGIKIVPGNKVPKIKVTYLATPPLGRCHPSRTPTRVVFHNTGDGEAQRLFVSLKIAPQNLMGLDTNQLEAEVGGQILPVHAELIEKEERNECDESYIRTYSVNLPNIPAKDSVVFTLYHNFCLDTCQQLLPLTYLGFAYQKPCGDFVSDSIYLEPDDRYLFEGFVTMDLGRCMQPGGTYQFQYHLKSRRLLVPGSRIEVDLFLPPGIRWAGQCLPSNIGGVTPVVTNAGGSVRLVFNPPFSIDSVEFPFCLRYDCDGSPGGVDLFPPEPQRGGGFTFLDGDSCRYVRHEAMLSVAKWFADASVGTDCALSSCQSVILSVNDTCRMSTGVPPPDSAITAVIKWNFDTYRLNYDLADNDDNRQADPGNLTAAAPGVRRDRFLAGDTMRVRYNAYVESGYLNWLLRSIWHEVAAADLNSGGNDKFQVKTAQTSFTNWDSFAFVRQFLRIRYADGTEARCPLPDSATFRSDMHYYSVQSVNTLPRVTLDELCTQRHVFRLSFQALFEQGCLPKPTLDVGDSLEVLTDFVLRMNYRPISNNTPNPPLVGFRTALGHRNFRFAWNNYPFRKSQYSGFRTESANNIFTIRACSNSTTNRAMRFRMRIARPNMFPYEVRPLARLVDYKQTTPSILNFQSAVLRYLALQDSIPVLANLPLNFTQQGNLIDIDFDPVFAKPIDEGFLISATGTFGPNCSFTQPDSSKQFMQWTSPHGMYYGYEKFDTTNNRLGYFASAPLLHLTSIDTLISQTTQDFSAVFSIQNDLILQAPNVWVQAVSSSGNIYNLSLQELPSQQIVSGTGNLFQIGNLAGFGKKELRISGKNRSCTTDTLTLIYGWNCTPLTTPGAGNCGTDTFLILLRVQNPELELNLVQEPPNIPLCEPSQEFEIEVYNAKIGSAFDVLGQVKLPQGVRIAPGSCQISYPVGSAFLPAADPDALAGNIFQWPVSALLPVLGPNGLQGVNQAPKNAVRIRFRIIADCNFAANLPLVYGASGVSACGQASNALNKPGKPLQIPGLGTPYTIQVSLKALDGTAVCGGSQRFSVQLTLLGASNATDSALVLLPPGVQYQTGSYTPLQNAPGGSPTLLPNGIRVAIPAGLPAFSIMTFEFACRYAAEAGCLDQTISVQTRIRGEAICASTGSTCPVYVTSGESTLNIGLQHPNFGISNAAVQGDVLNLNLSNLGTVPGNGATIQVWHDKDRDGLIGPNDALLDTWAPTFSLAPGQQLALQHNLSGNLHLCELLLRLPALENCACADKVFPIETFTVSKNPIIACNVQNIPLGVTAQTGYTYSWEPNNALSCLNCAQTIFVPGSGIGPGFVTTLTLVEQTAGCRITHQFELRFGPQVDITASATALCRGTAFTLQATNGAESYLWSGVGIVNPTTATQMLQANTGGTYSVIAVYPGNCRDTAYAAITVFVGDTTVLADQSTCAGIPVNILGQTTAQAGVYSRRLQTWRGCDSLILQTLKVLPPTEGRSEQFFCTGDTLRVYDTLLTQSGEVCRTFKNSNGCDSLHCVNARTIPRPQVVQPDTLTGVVGDTIVLNGPPGYQLYTWTPNVPPCNNCQNLAVTPDTSGLFTYTLEVRDDNDCSGVLTYLLLVPPQCDPALIKIPNAFTPNGDDLNEVFRPIVLESALQSARLQIFSRWGEKIYESSGPTVSWDGTVRGKPAPSDVYIYILDVTCSGGRSGKRWGDISLLR